MIKLAIKLEWLWYKFRVSILGLSLKDVLAYTFNIEVPADGFETMQKEFMEKEFHFFIVNLRFNGQIIGNIVSRHVSFTKELQIKETNKLVEK